jgi:hypothetical protein
VAILLYSGVLATAFAAWATQSITRSLGAQASATGFLAIPVVGLVSGALILGEQLGPLDVAGFALVLGGVAAASLLSAPGLRRARRLISAAAPRSPAPPLLRPPARARAADPHPRPCPRTRVRRIRRRERARGVTSPGAPRPCARRAAGCDATPAKAEHFRVDEDEAVVGGPANRPPSTHAS